MSKSKISYIHSPAFWLSIAIPLAAYLLLNFMFGSHTGTNYDAYQYSFALREGRALPQAEFDNASRLFVHAGYYLLLRPLVLLGFDAWTVFSLSSAVFMALSCGLLYWLSRELGATQIPALAGAVMFGLSSTALHYCNIPEIYPMWLVALIATLLSLWRKNTTWTVIWFVLAFLTYVQTILLLPVFWIWGLRRGTLHGAITAAMALATLLITLHLTGVSLISNLLRERVYLEIASNDPLWLQSGVVALRQSGAIIPLMLSLPLWFSARFGRAEKFILLVLLPNVVFASLWVKNHGAFFLPTAVIGTVLFSVLASRAKNYRHVLAVAIILTLGSLSWAWDEAAYDRSLGRIQYDFCTNALSSVQEDTLISTALFPRWQYVYSLHNKNTEHLRYSPWAYVKSQEQAMSQATRELISQRGAYADDTIHPGILSQLDPVSVYRHVGTLPKGNKVVLTLYRISGSTERQPE